MIYFLVDATDGDPLIKIGYSATPEGVVNRYRQHRSSNTRLEFYCAIEGDRIHEKLLHRTFAKSIVTSDQPGSVETFRITPDIRDYVEWLGEQAWAACTLDEVVDPWAHFTVETMWPNQDYRNAYAVTAPLTLFSRNIGPLRAPLNPKDRGSSFERDSNDWFTPPQFAESARRVMGSIDLDPATSHYANRNIRAERIYTKNQDGLAPSNLWRGNVWLNPPYGGLQKSFLERLVVEHEAGNVPQAVVCLNGYRYDTKWFQPMWRYALCFTSKRVGFLGGASENGAKSEEENNPTNGTVFVYLGPERQRFADEFRQHGNVVVEAVLADAS
jgi:hypothetical protein